MPSCPIYGIEPRIRAGTSLIEEGRRSQSERRAQAYTAIMFRGYSIFM